MAEGIKISKSVIADIRRKHAEDVARDLYIQRGNSKILTDREEKILNMRYGIGYDRPKTFEEIGREFGSTRERIRQIQIRALKKLESFWLGGL